MNAPMARKAWLEYLQKAVDEFDWGKEWPQREWVGLTKEDMPDGENPMFDHEYFIKGMVFAANILKEKNT